MQLFLQVKKKRFLGKLIKLNHAPGNQPLKPYTIWHLTLRYQTQTQYATTRQNFSEVPLPRQKSFLSFKARALLNTRLQIYSSRFFVQRGWGSQGFENSTFRNKDINNMSPSGCSRFTTVTSHGASLCANAANSLVLSPSVFSIIILTVCQTNDLHTLVKITSPHKSSYDIITHMIVHTSN